MALINIIIQDQADGSIDVRLIAEPMIQPGQGEFSTAQKLGAIAINAVHDMLNNEFNSKIQIVGADQMPH